MRANQSRFRYWMLALMVLTGVAAGVLGSGIIEGVRGAEIVFCIFSSGYFAACWWSSFSR